MNTQPTPDPATDTDTGDDLIIIRRTQALACCRLLGLDPTQLAQIIIHPDAVLVTYSDGEQRHPIQDDTGTDWVQWARDHGYGNPMTWVDTGSGPGYHTTEWTDQHGQPRQADTPGPDGWENDGTG